MGVFECESGESVCGSSNEEERERERCGKQFWMDGMRMRKSLPDKTCNMLWENFPGRGGSSLHSEKFAFSRRILPETRM